MGQLGFSVPRRRYEKLTFSCGCLYPRVMMQDALTVFFLRGGGGRAGWWWKGVCVSGVREMIVPVRHVLIYHENQLGVK